MVIAVTGGRYDRLGEEIRLTDFQISSFLKFLLKNSDPVAIVKHGCAKGTDLHIDQVCRNEHLIKINGLLHIEVIKCPILPTDGDRSIAPKIRNIRMIRNSHPKTELLLAFPGNRGTAHATNVALKIPIPVWKWTGSIYHGRFDLIN